MSCCCPHSRSGGRFFSWFAKSYRKRFERRGFEPSQKQLVKELEAQGFDGCSLLEIGSGTGYLHQTLLERGAASAVGIDLSEAMIREAQERAVQRELADRVKYLAGDFIGLQDEVEVADIIILDKVVCCYPDAPGLLGATLQKTGSVYGLTYPRWRWLTRAGVTLGALLMKLLRSDFRPYVHHPETIEKIIRSAGFEKVGEQQTVLWLTQVYRKKPVKAAV